MTGPVVLLDTAEERARRLRSLRGLALAAPRTWRTSDRASRARAYDALAEALHEYTSPPYSVSRAQLGRDMGVSAESVSHLLATRGHGTLPPSVMARRANRDPRHPDDAAPRPDYDGSATLRRRLDDQASHEARDRQTRLAAGIPDFDRWD